MENTKVTPTAEELAAIEAAKAQVGKSEKSKAQVGKSEKSKAQVGKSEKSKAQVGESKWATIFESHEGVDTIYVVGEQPFLTDYEAESYARGVGEKVEIVKR